MAYNRTTQVLGESSVNSDGSYAAFRTWMVGEQLRTNAQVFLEGNNGTAPIECRSATVCKNLNADLLDGAQRDEILSVESLRKLQDAINMCLTSIGASAEELLDLPELHIADQSREDSITTQFYESFANIRPDRDSDLSSSDLVARYGSFIVTADGRSLPVPFDGLFTVPQE